MTDCVGKNLKCEEESGAVCGYYDEKKRAECLCGNELEYDSKNKTCRGKVHI